MKRKIIPLARPDIQKDDIAAVVRVLRSGMLVQGREVHNLESLVNTYLKSDYCSAVSNGTASLQLALTALGIGPGDEVIVPALSYIATANVVELVGARCIFVDIHPRYFNIDETKIEQAITDRTKAIIPVHEFGLCANMPAIMKIAEKNDLWVIEDAACALGSAFNGKSAGSFGDFGSFSLHPRKAVTSGEGGLLITHDAELDRKIKILRNHGIEPGSLPMNFIEAGFNYRMTDFQAALVFNQIKRLDKIIDYRNKLASVYFSEIAIQAVSLPEFPEEAKHTWQTFHLLLENNPVRDRLSAYLKEHGVMSNYGAQCIPATTYYQMKYECDAGKQYPNAYNAYTCGLAIPLYERLDEPKIKYISKLINKFFLQ